MGLPKNETPLKLIKLFEKDAKLTKYLNLQYVYFL